MKEKKYFIWDLDGTLVDSYDAILDCIEVAYGAGGLDFNRAAIRDFILKESVHALFEQMGKEQGIPLKEIYSDNWARSNHKVTLMQGAREVLDWARGQGIASFIYTHKGPNALPLLESLGIADYFTEVVTNANGFKRKPDPEGVDYLVDKYALEREFTYYIGDRTLDVDVAINSGIHSINFCDYKLDKSQKIEQLTDIIDLF